MLCNFNELNLRKKLTNARGQDINFTYDLNGRIKTYRTPEGSVSFDYDDNGNIVRTRDKHGDITRTFDALNRVTSCTDTCGKTVGYEYDEVGDLRKIIYPDNTFVSYDYDENHNLVKVTDWAGRVTEYTYDNNNRVERIDKPNGTVVSTIYEKNKVKTTVEKTASGQIISGFEYIYDNLSRITEEKVLANSTKMCYTYDELGRVRSRTVRKLNDNSVISTENFTYDLAGNITDAPDSCFEYDTNNRLTSFNGHDVEYDCDGNMLCNGSLLCGYDSQNRLIYAGDYDYIYNAENVRVRNLCCCEETVYTYDTNCKLSQLLCKTTNGVTTKYVYGLGLIGEETNNVFKTYHFDSRGSTIAITNMNGTVTDTFAYDTYGKQIARTGTSDIIFRYNGRDGVVTDKNGLIYMRARYYSPDMRRFINADIVPGKLNNAITLNRYAYANANPIMFTDPLGLSVWSWAKDKYNEAKDWVEDKYAEAKDWASNTLNTIITDIEKTISTIADTISDNVALTSELGQEQVIQTTRDGYKKVEIGSGYSKGFDTGKPVNIVLPNETEWSLGIDVNIEDYGVGASIKSDDCSIGLHMGNKSLDFGYDKRNGFYYKTTLKDGDIYVYSKTSFEANDFFNDIGESIPQALGGVIAVVAIVYFVISIPAGVPGAPLV